MNVSPYELLRASKPQSTQSIVTAYDLYSCIKQKEPAVKQDSICPVPQAEPFEHPSASSSRLSASQRTHYISDIHAKHSIAGRHASFINQPIHEVQKPLFL